MFNAELLCMKCMKGMVSGKYCAFCGSPTNIVQERNNVLPHRTILNGRYLVGNMLGAGGFGVTYIGYDLVENRRIAIKEFMPNGMVHRKPGERSVLLAANEEEYAGSMERFLDEARIIYHYQKNPHILQVYSLFKENGTAYYIMEFLEGTDLKHLLKNRGGRMSWQEILPIAIQIIDALAVLHKDGVVHRDISPDNIFVDPGGRTTLIDFGAARLYMHKKLTVILKRKYAPIEQYESKGKQGPWTDIYALAATLYHCLTGCLPPEATERAYRDELKSFKQHGIFLEPAVESAIYRAMRVEPGERYQNIINFRDDLLGRQRQVVLVGLKGVYENARIEINGLLTVGRNPGCCQLIYSDSVRGISSIHCQFRGSQGGLCAEIRDMGSTYGTWVNGVRLEGDKFYRLSGGDTIHFGEEQIWRVEG